jgi:hypothetical protein
MPTRTCQYWALVRMVDDGLDARLSALETARARIGGDGTVRVDVPPCRGARHQPFGPQVVKGCMARKPLFKTLRNAYRALDDDDRRRLLKHAKRLADDDDAGGDRESLSPDNQPSYLAAADTNTYDQKREEIERGMTPDPRER